MGMLLSSNSSCDSCAQWRMTAQTAALLSGGARLQQQQRLLRANVFATTLASTTPASGKQCASPWPGTCATLQSQCALAPPLWARPAADRSGSREQQARGFTSRRGTELLGPCSEVPRILAWGLQADVQHMQHSMHPESFECSTSSCRVHAAQQGMTLLFCRCTAPPECGKAQRSAWHAQCCRREGAYHEPVTDLY